MGRAHSNAWRQVRMFFDLQVEPRMKVLCGRNREALERQAALWGWEETETDWRAAVERPDIDAVDVAVPNALHAPVAMAAAEAGKMVLCEKPLAVSAEEAARMARAARGVRNMVWYNYRRVPAVSLARRWVDEGRIGRVFHYRAAYLQQWGNDPTRPPNWKLDPGLAGSGVLGDLLSHVVDTALWLNGPVAEVSTLAHTFAEGRRVDDAVTVLARFQNGSVGTLEATRYAVGCRNQNRFEMHGERGMLRFNLEHLNYLEYYDATEEASGQGPRSILVTGPGHPYSTNFWKPGHVVGYEHTFIAALGDFLGAVAREEEFHPDFEDGLRVEQVLEAVKHSAERREWVAPISD